MERFAPKDGANDGSRHSFEVEFVYAGMTLTIPPDRSILEVVEEAGADAISSCREGTCSTCETRVVKGLPDHRDSVLTNEEQAANDMMMICVLRSRSARLVLEI